MQNIFTVNEIIHKNLYFVFHLFCFRRRPINYAEHSSGRVRCLCPSLYYIILPCMFLVTSVIKLKKKKMGKKKNSIKRKFSLSTKYHCNHFFSCRANWWTGLDLHLGRTRRWFVFPVSLKNWFTKTEDLLCILKLLWAFWRLQSCELLPDLTAE